MATRNLVIDSGIFIEFLRAKDKKKTTLYRISDKEHLFISAVTYYELLMGATSAEKKQDIALLTEDLTILSFSEAVAAKASDIYHQLRKANKMIEFRDIFIAATCIMHNAMICTLNKKHFERIEDLHVYN